MNKKDILIIMIANLISADTCISEETCMESEKGLQNLKESIKDFELSKEDEKLILEKIDNGIDIVRRDAQDFRCKKRGS
jgi:hypothetical protein